MAWVMLAGVGSTKSCGVVSTWCCGTILSCDWVTDSVNGCTILGAGFVIGGVGVWLGLDMGGVTFAFLLIPALPCPTLGLGYGWYCICRWGMMYMPQVVCRRDWACTWDYCGFFRFHMWDQAFVCTVNLWHIYTTRFCLGSSLYQVFICL